MKKKIIFVLFIFSIFSYSCKTAGFTKIDTHILVMEESALINLQLPILFKTEITILKNSFSGITIIKTLENTNHRVVFINEIGMKFFDFEIGEDTFIVHHIFSSLNKKALLNLFENDFKLMLFKEHKFTKISTYQDKKTEDIAIRDGKSGDFYFIDSEGNYFNRIKRNSNFRTILNINYSNFSNSLPDIIEITHENIKFEMNFERIYK